LDHLKIYKEDTVILEDDYNISPLDDKNNLLLVKNKSVDDRKRIKTMRRMKSMQMNEKDVFIEDPCLFSINI
jgi:hypothetical protein